MLDDPFGTSEVIWNKNMVLLDKTLENNLRKKPIVDQNSP